VVREIVLPETRPEIEWLRGRAVRKMSPRASHSAAEQWWAERLRRWAGDRGLVLHEWRFRVAPPGEEVRPLVPDVSYVSRERLDALAPEDRETPPLAPDVAVEIRSPGDSRADVMDKAGTLLRAGSTLVVIVNSRTRTVIARDSAAATIFSRGETFAHPALPGFAVAIDAMFEELRAALRPRG